LIQKYCEKKQTSKEVFSAFAEKAISEGAKRGKFIFLLEKK